MHSFALSMVILMSIRQNTVVRAAVPQPGDFCEIDGASFLEGGSEDAFTSRIAGGPGCALGTKTNCFCHSSYDIASTLWVWTCGDDISFGPLQGKSCPDTVAYERGFAGDLPACDTALNPSGLTADDPPCGYHDCADDGSGETATCGCVNLSNFGLGDGPAWVCLHSGCSCSQQQSSPARAPVPPPVEDDRKTRVPDGTTLGPTPSSAAVIVNGNLLRTLFIVATLLFPILHA